MRVCVCLTIATSEFDSPAFGKIVIMSKLRNN